MKTGKRIFNKMKHGWNFSSGYNVDPPMISAEQSCFKNNPDMELFQTGLAEEALSNKSTLQLRRNKATMPRPKSTGYLKDFNILSAQDDVEDDSDKAYDDFVYATHTMVQERRVPPQRITDVHKSQDLTNNNNVSTFHDECVRGLDDLSVKNDRLGNMRAYDGDGCYSNGIGNRRDDSSWKINCGSERILSKTDRKRNDFVLSSKVSGRAAYWQHKEDDSKEAVISTPSGIKRDWKTPGQIRQMKNQVDPKEMTQYIYDRGVANRAAMWQKLEDDHFEKMMINPDKEWKGPAIRVVLDRNHPEYGRPPKGSKTEKRGIKAYKHVVKEIGELCKIIEENGEKQADGTTTITFRKLFHTYVPISNKVVGILIRARKRGLLHFNGEMLYQRQDEDEIIRLISLPDEFE